MEIGAHSFSGQIEFITMRLLSETVNHCFHMKSGLTQCANFFSLGGP